MAAAGNGVQEGFFREEKYKDREAAVCGGKEWPGGGGRQVQDTRCTGVWNVDEKMSLKWEARALSPGASVSAQQLVHNGSYRRTGPGTPHHQL